MTNELFREVLEGKIPTPRRKAAPPIVLTEWQVEFLAQYMAPMFDTIAEATQFVRDFLEGLGAHLPVQTPLPTEPRARALAAKQRRGHGPPASAGWRGQDSNTISRSQLKVGSPRAMGTNRRHGRPPSNSTGGVGA